MAGRDLASKRLAELFGRELTVMRAAGVLVWVTLLVTIAGGFLMRLADPKAFPTIGRGMWFSVQTVTTVGYGDVTPRTVFGRFVASVVMLNGIAFIAVLTAIITTTFIENARRRLAARANDSTEAKLDEISRRLAALEVAVKSRTD